MLAAITAVWAAVFSCYALAFRAGSPLLSSFRRSRSSRSPTACWTRSTSRCTACCSCSPRSAVLFADSLAGSRAGGRCGAPPGARNRLLRRRPGRSARRIGAGAPSSRALPADRARLRLEGRHRHVADQQPRARLAIGPFVQIGDPAERPQGVPGLHHPGRRGIILAHGRARAPRPGDGDVQAAVPRTAEPVVGQRHLPGADTSREPSSRDRHRPDAAWRTSRTSSPRRARRRSRSTPAWQPNTRDLPSPGRRSTRARGTR